MASEYLKWKYRDVQPDAPPVLTPRQKRANWWHYHKWYVAVGAAVAATAVYLAARWLTMTPPDVQVAYVAGAPLPEDTVSALETALSGLAGGDASVRVEQYILGERAGEDALYAQAGAVRLMADLTACDSGIFLLDDPAGFQENYQILRRLDGTLPGETDRGDDRCWLPWAECPGLAGLDLGTYRETLAGWETGGENRDLLAGLYVARRGFWTEKTTADPEACDALWTAMTEGEQ